MGLPTRGAGGDPPLPLLEKCRQFMVAGLWCGMWVVVSHDRCYFRSGGHGGWERAALRRWVGGWGHAGSAQAGFPPGSAVAREAAGFPGRVEDSWPLPLRMKTFCRNTN